MKQNAAASNQEQLVDDFNAVIAETEQLLDTVKSVSGEKAGELRMNIDKALASARERLEALHAKSLAQANAAARATEEYVQENPWRSIGSATLFGLAAGLVIGVVISRR
jgi:ElaB/YqjD/DUF883 family membrane-anchored ribosome-binding protein